MHEVAFIVAAALYAGASVRYTVWFAQARAGTPQFGSLLVYAAVLVHAVAVTLYVIRFEEPPLVGLGPSLATLSLLIALALIVVNLVTTARAVGLFLAPAAVFLLIVALVVGLAPTADAPSYRGPWLTLHTSLSFLGYAGWVVAASAAAMYLAQFRQLKRKRLGAIFKFFPPLDTLDRLSERSLVAALLALTLGILVGLGWTLRFNPGIGPFDPKVVWGVLSWVVLSLIVGLRLSHRGTGREGARWNVLGFCLIAVVYVVMKLMAPETRFFL